MFGISSAIETFLYQILLVSTPKVMELSENIWN